MKITNINKGNLDEEITSRVHIETTRAEISMGEVYTTGVSSSDNSSVTNILIGMGIGVGVVVIVLVVIIVRMVNKKNIYKG